MGEVQSTRGRLIQLLSKSKDTFISGQALSDQLGITRSAIWKHMQQLEKDGYKIEGVTNKGYRIINYPDKVSEHTLRWGLQTKTIGQTIVHKETTESTQIIAHQLAREGAAHGTIVIADEQTAGRGRLNRYWHSTKEKGIWLSIILRPTILPYLAPQLTLLTATVIAEIIQTIVHVNPQIKWPNDLLINHKKVAGILTEMQAEQDQITYVVIGIGMNVNHTKEDIPTELADKATSLRLETDLQWNKRDLIQAILQQFEHSYETFIQEGFNSVKVNWEKYGYKLGEQILINDFKKSWQATLLGIADDGALLATNEDDAIKKIYSAEIEWYNHS